MSKRKRNIVVPAKANPPTLLAFAEGIEKCAEIARGAKLKYRPSAMQLRACRLIFGRNLSVAAQMFSKWVEWRYGRNPDEQVASMTVVLADVVNIAQIGDLDAARQIWLGRGEEAEHQGDVGSGASTQSGVGSRLLGPAKSNGKGEIVS